MVPAYTDVSHFRAPYKNGVLGAVAASAAPAASAADALASITTTDAAGNRVFKTEVSKILLDQLDGHSVIYVDPANAKLDPRVKGDPRPSAAAWAKAELEAGRSVLMGAAMNGTPYLLAVVMPTQTPGVEKFLRAVKPAEEPEHVGKATFPSYAVLSRPKAAAADKSLLASLFGSPIYIAAVVLGVAGIAYVATKKKRKG